MIADHNVNAQPPSHFEQVVDYVDTENQARVKAHALHWMEKLEGWCSQAKAGILMDLIYKIRPSKIVEIGVYGGKSLVPMAFALSANGKGVIYGIDPWDNEASLEELKNEDNKAFWLGLDHNAILKGLVDYISYFGLEKQIALIQQKSEDVDPIEDIDILHVDGNHSNKTSYDDVKKWVPLVKSGGLIIFDDMSWYENGVFTTTDAVEWLDKNCNRFAQFKDNCEWGVWIKP